MCILFRAGEPQPHLTAANLEEVRESDRAPRGGHREPQWRGARDGGEERAEQDSAGDGHGFAGAAHRERHLAHDDRGVSVRELQKEVLQLQSWTEDPRTEHFSGTGRYELDFEVPSEYVSAGLEAVLDLGKVGDVAEVTLNGQAVGVAWMQPYQLDITEAIRSGTNHLELLVTNTADQLCLGAGDTAGCARGARSPLRKNREYLHPRGNGPGTTQEKEFHPLPPSGLIGPVRIIPLRRVTLEL